MKNLNFKEKLPGTDFRQPSCRRVARNVIDNKVSMLKWILLCVFLIRIALLIFSIKLDQNTNEIDRFFEEELSRKYYEHSIEASYLTMLPMAYDEISKDSTDYLLNMPSKDRYPIFKRVRFQEYARYIRTLDTSKHKRTELDLKCYPKLLQNTVVEENAKRDIDTYFKHLYQTTKTIKHFSLKGLVSKISQANDSLYINLVPFSYRSPFEFDDCQCGSTTNTTRSNPFYYSGSLLNWKCTYQNRVSKEFQTIDLLTIE